MDRETPSDVLIKHLEFIQAVIARLANNSFLLKGWVLTVAGVFFGFAAGDLNRRIAAAGLLPVAAFWALDAYFLRQERLFRRLYDAVRRSDPEVELFSMDIRRYRAAVGSWWVTLLSMTLLPFYGVVLLVGLALILAGTFRQ